MTATATVPPESFRVRRSWWATRRNRLVVIAIASWVGVSLVRVLMDADDLTSSTAVRAAIRTGIPVFLAGMGGLFAERCGVVNIGLEGMMVLGTWFAGWGGWHWGPWVGIVLGILGGALGGLLHALATVTFGIDHIVSGVALNIIAAGTTRFLADQFFTGRPGGSISQSPSVKGGIEEQSLPFLSGGELFGWRTPNPLQWLEFKHWFLISDTAGLLHGLTSRHNWLTIIVILIIPIATYVLWRTPFGLRLRSAGEKPSAADSLGVDVYRMRYIGLAISGGFAGLGGSYLAINGAGRYSEGQVSGRGFIGLAMLIFGNWRPVGIAIGSTLYGFVEGVRLCCSGDTIVALVLLVSVALAALAISQLVRGNRRAFVATLFVSALFAAYFIQGKVNENGDKEFEVPREFTYMAPYVLTLLFLAFASQRLRPPAAAGKLWRKGDTG
ncbi:MAG TPA: ABC transporter permease [Acidimicrobiales bacterium]|nr:ABC transporter permease [Acidimicrobiales bacterium]